MVFFVLSGFFIHLRFSECGASGFNERWSTGAFYRRRMRRLVAPYLLALAITVLLDASGRWLFPTLYRAHTGDNLLDVNFRRKGYSSASIVPALFGLPSIAGADFGSNGPLWSLAYEVVYYAVYPLWLAIRRKNQALAWICGLLVGAVAEFLPGDSTISGILSHYPIWLAGALLSEVFCRRTLRPASVCAFCLFGLLGFLLLEARPSLLFSITSRAALGTSVVLFFGKLDRAFNLTSLGRFTEFLGRRSYSIYICHFPVLTFLSAWIIQSAGKRPESAWLAVAGVALALSGSILAFEICEKRILDRVSISSSPC
jgi:peptidoglycan/LPS O-acetylase OafA/YrhL